MKQPFETSGDSCVTISSAEIRQPQIVLSGVGLTLPEHFGHQAQKKADLLESRLDRIEKILGLQPICAD